jgi:uncharacterized repeat protein (TIGR03803 family)
VFALDPTTGAETVVHSFSGGTDGAYPTISLVYAKGMLFGTTEYGGLACGGGPGCGTVFSIDLKTGREKVLYSFCSEESCADGWGPLASLIDANGTLYGTTQRGGAYDDGTLFSVSSATGTETVLYSFCSQTNCTDGAEPVANLIDVNGTLYGTTPAGGAYGERCGDAYDTCGTVFALTNP